MQRQVGSDLHDRPPHAETNDPVTSERYAAPFRVSCYQRPEARQSLGSQNFAKADR